MKILETINGKKTYIIGWLTVLWAIIGFAIGKLDIQVAIDTVLAGFGIIGIRSALNKIQ